MNWGSENWATPYYVSFKLTIQAANYSETCLRPVLRAFIFFVFKGEFFLPAPTLATFKNCGIFYSQIFPLKTLILSLLTLLQDISIHVFIKNNEVKIIEKMTKYILVGFHIFV